MGRSRLSRRLPARRAAVWLAAAAYAAPALEITLFHDDFAAFRLGDVWQPHADGAPQLGLGLSSPGVLQLHSDGSATGFRGVETLSPLALHGYRSVTFDVRLRPINQGTNGSESAAELALFGAAGGQLRAFASNNVSGLSNDWRDFYVDSRGNSASSSNYAHCFSGGCDSVRRLTITVDDLGTTLAVRNADESLHPFAASFSNFTLADLGDSVTLALRQRTVAGADPVVGQFDSVKVSAVMPPTPGPLLTLPYRMFAEGPAQVRPLAGQTGFTLASYGSPASLPALAQFTTMLADRGLGNGIDLGPTPNASTAAAYAHIRELGWSFTAWPGPADHQVGGGSRLAPADAAVLATLDRPDVRTPIHFGEWGYFFHELSWNADYFASIYPGQPVASYAHLMQAPGSKGYDTPPVDRADAYRQMKAYYDERQAAWDGRIGSVTGHSHYEAYAAEWGTPTIGLEIGENIRFTQSKFAFARGAARQWDKPWSTQVSPWFHGALTTAGPLTGGPGNARGQDAGHSFSFYRRAWLHSWFAGAARVTPEFSTGNLFETASAPWNLTPLGELAVETAEIMRTRDRGVPYTPVAIVLDHLAGYNAYQDKPWGVFSKTAGDRQVYDLFQQQLFPGSANSNNPDAANPEAPYLVATPYGEMFDVLLSTAPGDKLAAYPEILLAGDVAFSAPFIDALAEALAAGSRLLLQQQHVDALGPAQFNRLQAAGATQVLAPWVNPATGRPAAISNSLLSQLNSQHLPIALSGDAVQYQVNRNAEGWVVELINNDGITKKPHLPVVIDPQAIARVLLRPQVDVVAAYDWLTGERFDLGLEAWNIAIAPGDVRYIQLVLGPEGDWNADGSVTGADLLAWQRGATPRPLSQLDSQTWELAFGVAPPIAAPWGVPVPECAAVQLLAVAWALLLHARLA
jgi:hypothetical protein